MSYLSDPISIAQTIPAGWLSVLGGLPQDIDQALDALYAAQRTEPRSTSVPDPVTDASQVIHNLADALAADAYFTDAKARVTNAAAKRVIALARSAVPDVIAKITPAFDAAVAKYCEAINELPSDISAEVLVTQPHALAAYQCAKAVERDLSRYESWVMGLVNLGMPKSAELSQNDWAPELRVLAPKTRTELHALNDTKNDAEARFGHLEKPVFVIAAREGIEFRLNTPAESMALYRQIEQQPVPSTFSFKQVG